MEQPGGTDFTPFEARLATVQAHADAIEKLILAARGRLLVFDRDLSEGAWNGWQRHASLTAFLRRSGNARLSVIVHDPRFVLDSCPRLVSLFTVYGHATRFWRTGEAARSAADALVIADDAHYLHRQHVDQPRATFALNAPLAAKPLVARFDEIWATGEVVAVGRVVGL
ncbi:MAG TPA: hypothetical protein VNE58_07525 [Casimicrobiaceae bacterium]|nr:hypothetical protein [Casimicrobiaceae bacterium]